jgi:hypothetical protein
MIFFHPQYLLVSICVHLFGFLFAVVASKGDFAAAPLLAAGAILNLLGMAVSYALLTMRIKK